MVASTFQELPFPRFKCKRRRNEAEVYLLPVVYHSCIFAFDLFRLRIENKIGLVIGAKFK